MYTEAQPRIHIIWDFMEGSKIPYLTFLPPFSNLAFPTSLTVPSSYDIESPTPARLPLCVAINKVDIGLNWKMSLSCLSLTLSHALGSHLFILLSCLWKLAEALAPNRIYYLLFML